VKRVPVITREEFERPFPFVRDLAEMIAELGLASLKDRASRRSVMDDTNDLTRGRSRSSKAPMIAGAGRP
jgi:hypothetical protein